MILFVNLKSFIDVACEDVVAMEEVDGAAEFGFPTGLRILAPPIALLGITEELESAT